MNKSVLLRRRRRVIRAVIASIGVLVLVLAAVVAFQLRPKAPKDPYRTAAVERGAITKSVSASGALQALVTVDVGSQISGQIRQVLVDFNDSVHKGQKLAILDPQTYQSRVAQGEADIAAGEANLRQAEATLVNAQADYERKKALVAKGIYSPSVLDQTEAAFRTARAAVTAAQAKVAQSRASQQSNRVDLGRTTIVAPIDGIVVDRKVEPGQTVAASLQAPVLFTLAQDLSKVQVKISVDEADIGQVREGQRARFTVDSYPDETFEGIVTQVRKQPTTDQNVVAYTVIAEADNPQGKLMPGMTANADIIVETRADVLKVPAAALRWAPADKKAASVAGPPGFGGPGGPGGFRGGQGGGQGGGGRGMMGQRVVEQLDLDAGQRRRWEAIQADLRQQMAAAFASAAGDRSQMRATMRKNLDQAFAKLEPALKADQKAKLAALRAAMTEGGGRTAGMRGGVVYVLRDGKPVPVAVRVGASDGTSTEVVGELKPGDQVVIGGGPKVKAEARPPFGGGAAGGPGGGARLRM